MSKFEYSKHSSITLAQARRGQQVVLTVRALACMIPIAGAVALVMFTPVWLWGPILGFALFMGVVFTLMEKGEDISDWYKDHRRNYNRAKSQGVRDE